MPLSFVVKCSDIEATENLEKKMAMVAEPRHIFLLNGTLGVGKSVFARAFIGSGGRTPKGRDLRKLS